MRMIENKAAKGFWPGQPGFAAMAMMAILATLGACSPPPGEIVVYSARNEHLIKPIFDRYTEETGVTISFVTDKEAPLMQRLIAEGNRTPADILMTVDAGNLWHAAENDLFQTVDSATLAANIPEHLRDPQNRWYGLSVRARTIVYSTKRVNARELSSYAALADEQWNGRLCLRTSKKVYNQSLVAMMIAEHGDAATEEIVRGWVGNLATDVFSNDTKVMEAIAAGQCDVGIVNTYYFGRLQKENPDIKLALFWPDQDGSGVHVNISGAGITRYAPHRDEAVRFLEWLSTPAAQGMFAGVNMEYPANPDIPVDAVVEAWGEFKPNVINVSSAGELQADAVKLMDRAGYH